MATDSLLSFDDIDIMSPQVIPLHGLISDPGTTSVRGLTLQCLNGYIWLSSDSSADCSALFKKNNQWEPIAVFAQNNTQANGCNYAYVHSDAFVHYNGSSTVAMNLRQDGAARNLNNAAALPGLPFYSGISTQTGYGLVTFQTLPAAPVGTRSCNKVHYEDDRFLIAATNFATDTSDPTVATPSAPTVAAATTGGNLADATYYIRIAWVTKTNDKRTSQGFTAYSDEATATVSGGGGAGRVDVTIPALPTNAIGYVVLAGTATGASYQYVVGGGGAAGTHVIKSTMAQLGMKDRFFYQTSTGVQPQTMGTIENLNPVTNGTIRAFTTGLWGLIWSPYFIDPTILWGCPSGASAKTQKADKFDIIAGTVSLDQTTTWNGEPNITYNTTGASSLSLSYRSIPELGAYAVINNPLFSSGNIAASQATGFVQIRSCFNNQLLWSAVLDPYTAYSQGSLNHYVGCVDFETINRVTYMMVASYRYRGIVRIPIRIMP